MNRTDIISGVSQLGKLMIVLGEEKSWSDYSLGVTEEKYLSLQSLVDKQVQYNQWFTKNNVLLSLKSIGEELTKEKLTDWTKAYSFAKNPKKVGLILAGNIPLVGFHDILSTLLSGNSAVCKCSSDDSTLLPALFDQLTEFVPELRERVIFFTGKIGEIDAAIATGSDNSVKYFEQYFGKYPHIFRKNRTSLAILNGNESKAELESLGEDIFAYFGLGCRNVSHLLIPKNYDLNTFFNAIVNQGEIVNHHKYANNYDYNKAIFLMNFVPILDNNFVLLRESEDLFSPLAVIHYHFYESKEEVASYLSQNQDKIQAVVGHGFIPFGSAQRPGLTDYADGIDTMKWLSELNE